MNLHLQEVSPEALAQRLYTQYGICKSHIHDITAEWPNLPIPVPLQEQPVFDDARIGKLLPLQHASRFPVAMPIFMRPLLRQVVLYAAVVGTHRFPAVLDDTVDIQSEPGAQTHALLLARRLNMLIVT